MSLTFTVHVCGNPYAGIPTSDDAPDTGGLDVAFKDGSEVKQ